MILERAEGREREGVKHHWFPLLHALTGVCADWDHTRDLSVHRTMLQPTEPHWPGLKYFLIEQIQEKKVKVRKEIVKVREVRKSHGG